MRVISRSNRIKIVSCLAAIVLAGCARTNAPRGWLPDAADAQEQAFGGWITVHYVNGPLETGQLDGELIAISPDSVYVLVSDSLHAIHVGAVSRAKVMAYNAHASALGTWTITGCLSTISHGFFSAITAPLWMICGGVSTSSLSHEPQEVYENPVPGEDDMPTVRSWDHFRPYARFPGGLPPDLDRKSLKPKTVAPPPKKFRYKL